MRNTLGLNREQQSKDEDKSHPCSTFFAHQLLFHRFRERQKNQRNPGDRETDGAKHTSAILLQQHGKIALCLRLRHTNLGGISATYQQAV